MLVALVVFMIALFSLSIYETKLHRLALTAPRLPLSNPVSDAGPSPDDLLGWHGSISVIIPVYNEVSQVRDCVVSVLNSTSWPVERFEVWVVDDQSTDATLAIVQALQASLSDPRLHVLAGLPRPAGDVWMGKNWACTQAVQQAKGEFLLFMDADVRLKPGAIEAALREMQREQLDLLTCWPAIVCSCFSEWLVQPLIYSLLMAEFDFAEVNDVASETAFAVGPFMLFRRTAYEQLGGHQAVAAEVVEDVELARRLKQKRMTLKYGLGHDLASVRMYQSWSAVWEGWTKNWYLGSRRNLSLTLYSAAIVLLVCTVPWVGGAFVLTRGVLVGFGWLDGILLLLAGLTILLQFRLRQAVESLSTLPPRYWWLTSIGGVLVSAIALASIIKTETGWGWTWRGRSLQLPNPPV